MSEKMFLKDTSESGYRDSFRVGDTPVRVSFRPGGESLGQKLEAYFSERKG